MGDDAEITRARRSGELTSHYGRIALRKFNNERWATGKKCCARTKSRGAPCQLPALENGRCQKHGGLTPRGDDWHRLRLPQAKTPAAIARFERKLAKRQREAAERAKRIAAMTPEQRAAYDAWCATHKPGKASVRASARQQRANNAWLRQLIAEKLPPKEVDIFE